MPIFEYECSHCQAKKEVFQIKTTDMDRKVCDFCGHPLLNKLPSAPAISKLATPAYS